VAERLCDLGGFPAAGRDVISNADDISFGDIDLGLVEKLVDIWSCDVFLFFSRRDLGDAPFRWNRLQNRLAFRGCYFSPRWHGNNLLSRNNKIGQVDSGERGLEGFFVDQLQ